MSRNFTLRKYEVEDFISIDSGTDAITLTKFNGRVQVGTPGWTSELTMTPDQAIEIAHELLKRAQIIHTNSPSKEDS